ncbi:MAG: hypothetical protein U0V48_05465 [Anaerolineales bacterium]
MSAPNGSRKVIRRYRLLLPMLAKRVRVIFTPSEYVKRNVMRRFEVENVIVTPNGVDTRIFRLIHMSLR